MKDGKEWGTAKVSDVGKAVGERASEVEEKVDAAVREVAGAKDEAVASAKDVGDKIAEGAKDAEARVEAAVRGASDGVKAAKDKVSKEMREDGEAVK